MNVTVIGAGFAALTAIKSLRKQSRDINITLISPTLTFQYYPSLIWVPSGLRCRQNLLVDIQPLLARLQVNHIKASVSSVEQGGRLVVTDQGHVTNDGLIIASGGRFIKKLPGIEHAYTLCEGIDAAEAIEQRLSVMNGGTIAIGFGANPQEPTAVRGGPMFELLFGIDQLLRNQGRRQRFNLVFFNPAQRPGNRLGDKAVDHLLALMAKRNISTQLGAKPLRFEADKVVTEAGEFAADLILFMPGMTGPAWVANSELPLSAGGLIKADKYCRVEGLQHTYVVGDSGSFPGPDWAPKQAHMADLMSLAASQNLLAELAGTPPVKSFRWELICIMDMLGKASLVFRNEKHQWVTPPLRVLHWLKRLFEWWYLRKIK